MSIPQARKGRHAAPAKPAGRRLAVAAAALAAGALPLACAGTAAAATAPQDAPMLPTLGLPDSAGPLAGSLPLAGNLPVTDLVTGMTAAERPTSALPLSNLVPQLAPASGGPLQLAPNVLRESAVGTLASGLSPQTRDLTGGLAGQAQPLVSQLRQTGVPTVGDLTGGLSSTQLPVVGTVGSVTQTLPVTTLLGTESPVTGALQNLSVL